MVWVSYIGLSDLQQTATSLSIVQWGGGDNVSDIPAFACSRIAPCSPDLHGIVE